MASTKPHVYVFPFPAQSHINPMFEFSKRLASNDNLNVTFILTTKATKSTSIHNNIPTKISNIAIESLSDGSEEIQVLQATADFFKGYQSVVSVNLTKFIEQQRQQQKGSSKLVLVYDSVFPWMLDIAHQQGLIGASFFTQSCTVSAIYCCIKEGSLRFPFEDNSEVENLPFLNSTKLGINDLPSFLKVMDANQTMVKLLGDQFSNLEDADLVLFNSFDKLENEVVDWMASRWTIKTIGPTNLLGQTNNNYKNNHMINLFEIKHEVYTKWLDSKESGTIIYVSFGSLLSLEQGQMEELACGLMASEYCFLWVVRPSEEHKLPHSLTSLPSEKGLIVNWCSQTEVLAHRAIACFLTHGGWNSTVEGVSYGVPLIAMSHWIDQMTNAKFIEDVWQVGIRVKCGEDEMISREDVSMCVKDVVEGLKGNELRRNANEWRKLAKEAIDDGGTSAKNIEDIVSRFLCI